MGVGRRVRPRLRAGKPVLFGAPSRCAALLPAAAVLGISASQLHDRDLGRVASLTRCKPLHSCILAAAAPPSSDLEQGVQLAPIHLEVLNHHTILVHKHLVRDVLDAVLGSWSASKADCAGNSLLFIA